MKKVILSGGPLQSAIDAAKLLKESNSLLANATKQVEAAKSAIASILKDNREIDIETLNIGEMVLIDGVMLIECSKQNKFDSKSFMLAEPAKFAEFKRDFPTRKYKSLISAE